MADKTVSTNELKLVVGFEDGDDRTLTVPNPTSGLTKASFNGFDELASLVLEGDKAAADYKVLKSAKIHESTTVYLDIKPTE